MAPEVNALLRVYEKSAEVDVERINWAPLPTAGEIMDDSDPNLRIYRTEVLLQFLFCLPTWTHQVAPPKLIQSFLQCPSFQVVTSINDCVLRSRSHTKYLVSADLDEIIVARKEASLLKMLDKEQKLSNKSRGFIIRSSYALYEVHPRPLECFYSYF
ncbi:unnamed protein product [Gongylonema pulchrum]|uniref:Glycosyltransferase family 92 protein n=1 Tax=Gongylonema pulchrum TaxID=637853 RepID=A0A183DDL9_9BILA|nr:unnamed protein product [Gongylonema pulchrum]